MKKLMTAIGAALTSFGLFAEPADNYSSTSFEKDDDGCDSGKSFEVFRASGWSTTAIEPFALVDQDKGALPYLPGTKERRDDFFRETDINTKCLKVEIPSDTLERTIGEGQIYVDQLVKFTAYASDPALVSGSKLAVWMKEDESGESGLYATVGTGSGVAKVRIAGDYTPSKWYRLTIKALGNVLESGIQAGFLVYINGGLASVVEGDRGYLDGAIADDLTTDAGNYYAEGRLFASIDPESATISSIVYSGFGWVDDLIVSETAPKFAEDPYVFTVTPPEGLEVVSVETNGELLEEPYTVPPGTEVRITYAAAEGWKIMSEDPSDVVSIDEDGQEITETTVEYDKVCARLSRKGVFFGEYVAAELYEVMTSLQDGDQVLFTGIADIYDGDLMKYGFTENTKLTVEDNDGAITWKVDVFNDGWGYEGTFSACDKIEETKTINAWFESEDGILSIQADVAGSVQADVGLIAVENDITVSGVVTAANIVNAETITLSGAGKLVTQNDELNDVYADDGSELEILENIPEEGWFTYQIGAPAPVDPVDVIIADKVEGYSGLTEESRRAAYDNVQHLYNRFGNVERTEAWIAGVYGDGAKIPVSKFVATTEELIDISVKYDLPIMTAEVAVEISQAADGAFTFKLVDEGEPVSLNAAVQNVEQMIEWSDDLVNFEVNTDEVSVTVDDDNVTLKAIFAKPDGETKGFMRLRLFADE